MADERETLFELPTIPEGFGIILPPASLRRIDFSSLDFDTARRAIIEYITTYYPNDFNDFVAGSGTIMWIEVVASAVAKLALRGDILANEATLPTARTEEAIANHLALINQRIRRQTPAVVEIEVSVASPVYTDIHVSAGTTFTVRGTDSNSIYYELYRAPGDFRSDIIVPAGKRGVIAYGVEGRFASPVEVISSGGPDQTYTLEQPNILEWPIMVDVLTGQMTESWAVTTSPLERHGPTDKVAEITFRGDRAVIRFGNNISGAAPLSGQRLKFRYRVGGGARGRIGVGQINDSRQVTPRPPANAPVQVLFRNVSPATGGTDRESLEEAKRRAPRDYALRSGIVTADDYAQSAQAFSHPAFGSIVKAVATVRTGLNANLVEVYCLAVGPGGQPVTPNAGLKAGLKTHYERLNVLTDHVAILDGKLRPVDVDMTVSVSRNVDASVIKTKCEQAITDFFRLERWEMGQPLYTSKLIELIELIDGVAHVDLFSPPDNLLSGATGDSTGPGVGIEFNELIVEGKRTVQYFYERISK